MYLQLSTRSTLSLSLFGTGVLVSSALAIVIPEGCEVLYKTAANLPEASDTAKADTSIEGHGYIGLAIVCGFVLMFLIEQMTHRIPSSSQRRTAYIAVDSLGDTYEDIQATNNSASTSRAEYKSAFGDTLGLCIHSLADGVALASSANSTMSMGIVVFVAILLHKGPAAFGLGSILQRYGLKRRSIHLHLLAFSLAAPLGAIITQISIGLLHADIASNGSSMSTGLILLFSAGTFLFVAVAHMPHEPMGIPDMTVVCAGLAFPVLIGMLMPHNH